ncbi:MAG: PIN domain-containing protein [Egibacteraceae bacterium]
MGAAGSRPVVLDAGALIALERGHPQIRSLVRLAHEKAVSIVIPAGALGQVWRDGARQARLAALVGSPTSQVEILDESTAKAAGALCGRSGTADLIDASVVLAALTRSAIVVTSDPHDLLRIHPALPIEVV